MIFTYKQFLLEKSNAITEKGVIDIINIEQLLELLKTHNKLGFHSGNLEKTSESGIELTRGRDTGHFGNGNYFFGNILDAYDYAGKGTESGRDNIMCCDFSKYNTLDIKNNDNGWNLHKTFKALSNEDFGTDNDILFKKVTIYEVLKKSPQSNFNISLFENITNELNNYKGTEYISFVDSIYEYGIQDEEDLQILLKESLEYFLDEFNSNYVEESLKKHYIDITSKRIGSKNEFSELVKNLIECLTDSLVNFIKKYKDNDNEKQSSTYVESVVQLDMINALGETFYEELTTSLFDLFKEEEGGIINKDTNKYISSLNVNGIQIDEDTLFKLQDKYLENLKHDDSDSISKIILEHYGYEGICVFGLSTLDRDDVGSIIFDIKPDTVYRIKKELLKGYNIDKLGEDYLNHTLTDIQHN